MAYQQIFIGPLVWKCSINNFELLLSENSNLKILPRVRVRQNDRKNDGVPKNVYWPIGLKMFHK